MANFVVQLPNNLRLRSFTVSSSSNGVTPGVPQSVGPVILELPFDKIRRPLMRTRSNDQQKVKELMDSIKEIGLQVPGFLVSHCYEARQQLGLPTIRCKVRRGTKETLRFLPFFSSHATFFFIFFFNI
ncbi:hypothetical protein RND71_012091 [Anisodus tanguticus]|uniref:sulfiredoxin n=1 Tax=Anisodus tanguticus TaxID=243964 RepID=A0AAE1SF12_9SOLA|nr:hypothetical protein RND71_012091 [Anisodus tanguticus]